MVSNRCNDYGTLKFIIMKNTEIKFRSFYNNKTMLYSKSYVNLQFFFELKPEQFPLMQYTGLKDKNGKEIYEGDIVTYKRSIGNWTGKTMTTNHSVVFLEKVSAFVIEDGSSFIRLRNNRTYEYEVIGNIHENPELCTK